MFTDFDELFETVKTSPRVRLNRNDIREFLSENSELPVATRRELISCRKVHPTLFFEEVLRGKILSFDELLTLSATSAPGAVAIIKNINLYSAELKTAEGLRFLHTLLTPLPRASRSVAVVRSKKETVSALCTREGFFTFAREADEETKALYVEMYGETLEFAAVNYIISVYAQELVLSDSDKSIVLARVAKALKKIGESSEPAKALEFFIRDRFYFRIFEPVLA